MSESLNSTIKKPRLGWLDALRGFTMILDGEVDYLPEQAFLNAGLRIRTEDRREGREKSDEMHYEGGIRQFVQFRNKNKTINYDEELIILFYSVLQYLRQHYFFPVRANLN